MKPNQYKAKTPTVFREAKLVHYSDTEEPAIKITFSFNSFNNFNNHTICNTTQ